ncbi:hypothetical protein CHARACLAT_028379 [Characodon lateralis]|uniref:Uncharacterized protein n=1 Tax=Characodon lateralis TaxID=208331 RepID=A0ABU7D1F8_9TELE|nr:hypothetical protein [Characodon lateralis]
MFRISTEDVKEKMEVYFLLRLTGTRRYFPGLLSNTWFCLHVELDHKTGCSNEIQCVDLKDLLMCSATLGLNAFILTEVKDQIFSHYEIQLEAHREACYCFLSQIIYLHL